MSKQKRYRIVTKPTSDAFAKGKRTQQKIVSEEWFSITILAVESNPDVERYFYEEYPKKIK